MAATDEGFPRIVCLCGSTRFWRLFQEAGLSETLAGRIVLSIGAATASDEAHFAHLPPAEAEALKARLDELHLRKIDLADEILVLNQGDYVGPSTRRELAYARRAGKGVRWCYPSQHARAGEATPDLAPWLEGLSPCNPVVGASCG